MKEYDDGYEISKSDIIDQIAEDTYTSKATVRSIYDCFEQRIFDYLCLVSEEKPYVKVNAFDGFVIEGEFMPAVKRKNNLDGKMISIKNKIKAKASFTKWYKKMLSNTL